MNIFEARNISVFNSPLEIGLRSLYVLKKIFPNPIDLQRLVYYDYLLLHSSDVDNGPKSLHPEIPHRATEIFVKREILQKGLLLMKSKELVELVFSSNGIGYRATPLTEPFLKFCTSEYAKSLENLSAWLIDNFDDFSDKRLEEYVKDHLDVWGGEFGNESLFRGAYAE